MTYLGRFRKKHKLNTSQLMMLKFQTTLRIELELGHKRHDDKSTSRSSNVTSWLLKPLLLISLDHLFGRYPDPISWCAHWACSFWCGISRFKTSFSLQTADVLNSSQSHNPLDITNISEAEKLLISFQQARTTPT